MKGVTNGRTFPKGDPSQKNLALAIKCAHEDSQRCETCGKPRWMHYNLIRCDFIPSRIKP